MPFIVLKCFICVIQTYQNVQIQTFHLETNLNRSVFQLCLFNTRNTYKMGYEFFCLNSEINHFTHLLKQWFHMFLTNFCNHHQSWMDCFSYNSLRKKKWNLTKRWGIPLKKPQNTDTDNKKHHRKDCMCTVRFNCLSYLTGCL